MLVKAQTTRFLCCFRAWTGRFAAKMWLKNRYFRLELNLKRMPRYDPVGGRNKPLDLARVLVVHGELAPRLALQTILQAGGYAVETAATSSEAFDKLDEGRYALVLSDVCLGPKSATRSLLAYARMKEYRPATAMITLDDGGRSLSARERRQVAIRTEDLPLLLGKVAELIGLRASRRYRPLLRAV